MNKLLSVSPRKSEPFPFNVDQEAFIKELETTDKAQGRGWLALKEAYCCLGIACVLFGAERESNAGDRGDIFKIGSGLEENRFLPNPLVHRLRLRNNAGNFANYIRVDGVEYCNLTGLNDDLKFTPVDTGKLKGVHKFSFKDIAAYLRHDPWNVFMRPDERYPDEGIPLS